MTTQVTDPVPVVLKKQRPPLEHKTNAGECWIVEYPAGFAYLLDALPRVVFHVARETTVEILKSFINTRLWSDFAVVQAESYDLYDRKQFYSVGFVAGRSGKVNVNIEREARNAVSVVRTWHYENERVTRNGNDRIRTATSRTQVQGISGG